MPTAFVQRSMAPPYLVTIPLDRGLLFRTGSYRDSPEGESILRAAYDPWDKVRKLQFVEAVGVERDLAGYPVMWIPAEFLATGATAEQKASAEAFKRIVTSIRRNEQEGMLAPLQYDDQNNPIYKLELLSTGGQRQFNTDAVIRRYEQAHCDRDAGRLYPYGPG